MFYVTDLTNKKITSPQRHNAIRERLLRRAGRRRRHVGGRPSGSDTMALNEVVVRRQTRRV